VGSGRAVETRQRLLEVVEKGRVGFSKFNRSIKSLPRLGGRVRPRVSQTSRKPPQSVKRAARAFALSRSLLGRHHPGFVSSLSRCCSPDLVCGLWAWANAGPWELD